MPADFSSRLRSVLDAATPSTTDMEGRAAAVLIPIVAGDRPHVLFTVRTETLSSHKGQISFPGGSIDETDGSPQVAALRETQEEIGLDPASVEVLGELDTFPTFVSGYIVTPFVGWLSSVPELKPNPDEVAEVLEVPIDELIDAIRFEPGFAHEDLTYPTEAWVWNGYVIWGVTARIVRLFLTRVSEAGLGEAPGPTRSWTGWPLPA